MTYNYNYVPLLFRMIWSMNFHKPVLMQVASSFGAESCLLDLCALCVCLCNVFVYVVCVCVWEGKQEKERFRVGGIFFYWPC